VKSDQQFFGERTLKAGPKRSSKSQSKLEKEPGDFNELMDQQLLEDQQQQNQEMAVSSSSGEFEIEREVQASGLRKIEQLQGDLLR